MTALDQAQAVVVPALVFAALIVVGVLFAKRVKRSGWLLIAVSVTSLAVWPYQLVWLTGGV
jgi:uncharacterized membrane protein YoaT (DUF817 family)